MDASLARRLWRVGEPVHAIIYFHPASAAAWADAGIRGFWRGYFATRAAPLGPVGPGPVTAAFYNFHPAMVAKALPEVWTMATPEQALAARLAGADAALRDVLGADADAVDIAPTADALRAATDGVSLDGRALFAANASFPWPDPPLLALWHGLTLLREHRGDGHNAALLAAGIEGCAAHVLAAAVGGRAAGVTQPARGWSDDEWSDASRGAGGAGPGRRRRRRHRRRPLAARGHRAAHRRAGDGTVGDLDDDTLESVTTTLARLAGRVASAGVIRFPNPMGLPAPD